MNCVVVVFPLLFLFVSVLSEPALSCNTQVPCLHGGTFNTGTCKCDCNSGWYGIECGLSNPCSPNGAMVLSIARPTQNSCFSQATGVASIQVTGGVAPFTVYIDGTYATIADGSPVTVSQIFKGPHTLSIVDSNSCSAQIDISVPNFPELKAIVEEQSNVCFREANGQVVLNATGGAGDVYLFSIDGSTPTPRQMLGGLAVGAHTGYVQDTQGCTDEFTVQITQLSPLLLDTDMKMPKCHSGEVNITLNATGGSGIGYLYTVNGKRYRTNTVTVNGGDSLTLQVTDSNGCTSAISTTSVQNIDELVLTVSQINSASCGSPNGSVLLTATGGSANYTYSKDGLTYGASNTISSLSAGLYTMYVKDANGCTASASGLVSLQGSSFMAYARQTNTGCYGSTNGQVDIAVRDGSTPYSYRWNGVSYDGSPKMNLAAGIYPFDVTDSNNCTFHNEATINSYPEIIISANFIPPLCFGDSNGYLKIYASGGSGPLSYKFGTGAYSPTAPEFYNLSNGTYHIEVKDANCAAEKEVFLATATQMILNSTATSSSWCASNGQIIFSPPAELETEYEYDILNNGNFTRSNTFSNLAPGVYPSIHVRNRNGCITTLALVTVGTTERFLGLPNVTAECGTCTVSMNPSNFMLSQASYSMDGITYGNSSIFPGIFPGRYTLYVKDPSGCVSGFIANCVTSAVTATLVVDNATCSDSTDGKITIIAAGGSGSYSYFISGKQSAGQIISNLAVGGYSIAVYDGSCFYNSTVTVSSPPAIKLAISKTEANCNSSSGSLNAIAAGGSGPYLYSIDGQNFLSNSLFQLALGNYTVYVRDIRMCNTSSVVQITKKVPTLAVTPASCAVLGTVAFVAVNEVYRFSVDGGAETYTTNFAGLTYGIHNWTAKDSSGCITNGTVKIEQVSDGCANLTTCITTANGPICSPCPLGYTGNGIDRCIAVRNCSLNNGGCAYSVSCQQITANNVSCGRCPNGTEGDGTYCTSLCGNSKCDVSENCLTCAEDCGQFCGMCGDGQCNANETCGSCYQDCGLCVTCAGGCGLNGLCVQGFCVCSGNYSGPACEDSNQDMQMIVETTAPSLAVVANLDNAVLNLSLSVSSLSEYSFNGTVLRTISIANQSFHYVREVVKTNERFNLSTTFENGATLNVTIWLFHESQIISFANTTSLYLPNSVKVTIMVSNWPFLALSNYLGIAMSSSNRDSSSETQVRTSIDEQGNLKWIKLVVNGIALFGQFTDKAVLDGYVRTIKFALSADGTITTIVPHFWKYADVDPNYAVLLDSKSKSSTTGSSTTNQSGKDKAGNGINKSLIIIIPVTVGAIFIVALFVCFAVPRIRVWAKVRKAYRRSGSYASETVELDGSDSPTL